MTVTQTFVPAGRRKRFAEQYVVPMWPRPTGWASTSTRWCP